MELYGVLFTIGFLTAIGIILYKLFNVLSGATKYEVPTIIITFIGYFLAWIVCFIVLMQDPEEMAYASLLYLLNWMIIVNVMLSISEIAISFKNNMSQDIIKPFGSGKNPGIVKPYSPALK